MQYTFEIAEHIARRDAIDFDFTPLEPFRAAPVVSKLFGMLMNPPIDLDGQPRLDAAEVEDVGTDRMLAAKPGSTQPTTA